MTRKKLFAVVAGALLGTSAVFALDQSLTSFVEHQARRDADATARLVLALAEKRTTQAMDVLSQLAQFGKPECAPDYLTTLRAAVFTSPALKEISVLGHDGGVLCTSNGLLENGHRILAGERLPNGDGYAIELIDVDGDQADDMIRIRRVGEGLAALIPSELFLPRLSSEDERPSIHLRMTTASDMEIARMGEHRVAARDYDHTRRQSEKFGYTVDIATPQAAWNARRAELRWLTVIPVSAVGLLLAAFVCLRPRRDEKNPVRDMRQALANGEFIPYYQPIVDIRSGQLRGAEVLMRWRKPDGTIIPPSAFIPLAESSGLIHDMTLALMKSVCAEAGPEIGRRRGMKISFNFAAKLFANDIIVDQVRHIFARSPIKLSQVVFELTERDSIENFTETRRVVAALQGLGARIAIDDVGTGHAGLSYMLKLGVDIIKIDKMFVDAIGTDRNSTTIVETLVDLAHNMRMDIIAEGVENFEQVMHLRDLGIRHAQGYVFAPPLPGSSFLQLVQAIDPEKTQAAADLLRAAPALPAAAG
ncbi:MAG: EAL domain-containing protein [Xanthobacteraceae bacterium]|uniref:EAL domain-containing protein n=1 Tax=Pseudolabrys sp. TaxID=1960880 RepID=UPI003D1094B4